MGHMGKKALGAPLGRNPHNSFSNILEYISPVTPKRAQYYSGFETRPQGYTR